MILLVFCRTRNIERTHKDLSSILGLSATTAERLQLERKAKSLKRKYDASSSETGKDKRHAAKVTSLMRMGDDDKSTSHKSERLSTTPTTKNISESKPKMSGNVIDSTKQK